MWKILVLSGTTLLDGLLLLSFWRQFRRHGDLGIAFFRPGKYAQNIQDAATVLLLVLLPWQAMSAAGRSYSKYLAPTDDLLVELSRILGLVLLFGGVLLCSISQRNLGSSWRIGVTESAKPGLITSGLYRYSRNPIFLGLLAAIAGYACLLPTVLSLMILVGAFASIRRQIAVEEKYLLSTYGDAYRAYAQGVGRFIPLMGRMRPMQDKA
jgi:protein-S-isoprenylcysteine O-methyltransferase Ste14